MNYLNVIRLTPVIRVRQGNILQATAVAPMPSLIFRKLKPNLKIGIYDFN